VSITATVSGGTPITARISGSLTSARISAATILANVSAGVGPPGPPGPPGGSALADLVDVDLGPLETGDVLRFNGTVWTDRAERDLTDGGNF
jgi:hypothetical protein